MKLHRIFAWTFAYVAIAVALTGCVPERYQWSPDGRWMTVIGDHALGFADANGKLLPAVINNGQAAAWFPDSTRLVVARQIQATSFAQASQYMTPQEIQDAQDAAQRARALMMTYNWSAPNANDWGKFKAALTASETQAGQNSHDFDDEPGAVGLLVVEHADDALRSKVPPERWKELTAITQSVYSVDICTLDSAGAHVGANLLKSLTEVDELRIASTGKAALIVAAGVGQNKYCQLWVVSTDSSHAPVLLTEQSSWFPDWTPDGRSVAYVEPYYPKPANDSNDPQIGTLYRVNVIGSDAKVLDQPKSPDGQNSRDALAGMMCNTLTRVRCLPDGQIVFSSVELTSPCTAQDMPQRPELFSVDGKVATVRRLLPRGTAESIGDSAQFFEPSPDGRFVSIPDRSGKVDVIELSTGTLTEVQSKPMPGKDTDQRLFSVPTWRNNNELTFVVPSGDKRPDVVLWSLHDSKAKTLSAAWPGEKLEDVPATQPTGANTGGAAN